MQNFFTGVNAIKQNADALNKCNGYVETTNSNKQSSTTIS